MSAPAAIDNRRSLISDNQILTSNAAIVGVDTGKLKLDNFRNANQFLTHRKALLNLWQSLSGQDASTSYSGSTDTGSIPTDNIAPVDLVSVGTGATNPATGKRKRNDAFRQVGINGKVVSNMKQLYEAAAFVKPTFDNVLRSVASQCNLSVHTVETPEVRSVEVGLLLCPLKLADRATDKMREKYMQVDPTPACSWIYDVARASFVCDTEEQIKSVCDMLSSRSEFEVIRKKNRFHTPAPSGYRDILLNVRMKVPHSSGKKVSFVCEVVVTHIDLRQYEVDNDTRAMQLFFRPFFNACTIEEQTKKVDLLERVIGIVQPIINYSSSQSLAAMSTTINTSGSMLTDNSSKSMNDQLTDALTSLCNEASTSQDIDTLRMWMELMGVLGEFEIAEKFQRKILALKIAKSGEQSSVVGDALHILGNLLVSQKKLPQALALFEREMTIKIGVFGESSAEKAAVLSAMAEVRMQQLKMDVAIQLHEQAVAIRRKVFGSEHADLAVSLTTLGSIMEMQQLPLEAISYYSQALDVWQAAYTEFCPYTAACLNSLALIMDESGKSTDAKPLFEKAVLMCSTLYGQEHAAVAASMNNLALCMKKLGQVEDAKRLYTRALAIRRACFGEKHPAVATTLNNLGLLLKQQQNYDEARKLYIQALQIRRETLGPKHVDVAASLNNLALLHEACGMYGEGLVRHEETLAIRMEVFGPSHPAVAETLVNIGLIQKRNRNFDEARDCFQKALTIYEGIAAKFGGNAADNEDVVATRHLLATLFDENNDESRSEAGPIGGLAISGTASSGSKGKSSTMPGASGGVLTLGSGYEGSGEGTDLGRDLGGLSLSHQYSDGTSTVNASHSTDDDNDPKMTTMGSGSKAMLASRLNLRVHRSEHETIALSLRTMALTLQSRGELQAAQPLLEQSLGLFIDIAGGSVDRSENCADAMIYLAVLLRELGKFKICFTLLESALEIYRNLEPATLPKVVNTTREIAVTLTQNNEFSASNVMLQQALNMAASIYNESDPEMAEIITDQGINAREMKRQEKAKECFEKALEIRMGNFGDCHPLVASSLSELALVHAANGDYSEARSLYELALGIYVRISVAENGRCNKEIALTHRRIGLTYKEQAMYSEAYWSILEAVKQYSSPTSGLSKDSLQLASTLNDMALVGIQLTPDEGGGLEASIHLLNRALEIRERRLGRFHKDTTQLKYDMAVALRLRAKELATLSKWTAPETKTGVDPPRPATYDTSMAILLLEDAAEVLEKSYKELSDDGKGLYNLRELANVSAELGSLLIEEQLWGSASTTFDKLLVYYKEIYQRQSLLSSNGDHNANDISPTMKQNLAVINSNVKSLQLGVSSDGASGSTDLQNALGVDGAEGARLLSMYSSSMNENDNKGSSFERVFALELNADSDEVAKLLSDAAFVAMRSGKLKRAKELFHESLEMRLRLGQKNALPTSDVLINMGELREREKKYNKSKELLDQAMQIRFKVCGGDHPSVAEVYEEIGHVRFAANKLDKAEQAFRSALKIRRSVRDQVKLKENIAGAVGSRSKKDAAQPAATPVSQAALVGELFEADDKLSYCIYDLGRVLEQKGDFKNAKALLDEAIAIRRKMYAPANNPAVLATFLFALGHARASMGDLNEAKEVFLECLQIREDCYGPEDRHVVEVLRELAQVLDTLDEAESAEMVLEQALAILIRLNKSEMHEDVAQLYSILGMFYFRRENYPQSVQNFSRCLAVWMNRKGIESEQVTEAMLNLAFALKKNNQPKEARDKYEQAAAVLRRLHGYEHPDVASVLASLSSLSFFEKKYQEALEYSKQVLEIRKKIFGREHVNVIETVANQAVIYERLLMNKNAHKMHMRVLTWRQENLKPNDLSIGNSLVAVSDSFRRLGNIPEAVKYNDRALVFLRTNLGHQHEATVQRVGVAGELLRVQGRYVEAESHLRFAVDAMLLASGGAVTPSCFGVMLSLAGVAKRLGRFAEAEKWYRSVLAVQEELYGHDSTDVGATLNNLGVLFMEQFRCPEAFDYLTTALKIRKDAFGDMHPDVAATLNNLGSLQEMMGQLVEAMKDFEKSLEIRVAIFGSEHPTVCQSMNNIANLMALTGKYEEALVLFKFSQDIVMKLFGERHPEVATTSANIAACLDAKGEFNASKSEHEVSMHIRKDTYGPGHASYAQSLNNMGGSLVMQGKLKDASAMFQEALEIRRRLAGGDHNVEVAQTLCNQSNVLVDEGRFKAAVELQKKASYIMEDILGARHPYTVFTKTNLGISYRQLGDTKQGVTLLRDAAEYLQSNDFSENHVLARKLRNEIKRHGDFMPSGGNPMESQAARKISDRLETGSVDSESKSSHEVDFLLNLDRDHPSDDRAALLLMENDGLQMGPSGGQTRPASPAKPPNSSSSAPPPAYGMVTGSSTQVNPLAATIKQNDRRNSKIQ